MENTKCRGLDNMPQPFAWLNDSNITSIEGFMGYNNTVTQGAYAPILVLSFFIIVLFATGNWAKNKAILVSAFLSTIFASFLWILGVLAWYYVGLCLAGTILSFLMVSKD